MLNQQEFLEAVKQKKGCAVIIAGSDSDKPHIDKISKSLDDWTIPYQVRICSAHKQPDKLYEIIKNYNLLNGPIAMILVAGGTDALSGTASFHLVHPSISCPPDAPNNTCLTNPPGSSNAYIARADNVGKFVAQMFSYVNSDYRILIEANNKKKIDVLEEKDKQCLEGKL